MHLTPREPGCKPCGTSPPPCVCASGQSCIQIAQSCSACAFFTCVTSGLQPIFPMSTLAPGISLPSIAAGSSIDVNNGATIHHEGAIIGGSVGGGVALIVLLVGLAYCVLRRFRRRVEIKRREPTVYEDYDDDHDSQAPALMRESERGFY